MSRVVEQETICLHPEDAVSIKLWMDRLQEMKINVFYKDKLTPPLLPLLAQSNSKLKEQS